MNALHPVSYRIAGGIVSTTARYPTHMQHRIVYTQDGGLLFYCSVQLCHCVAELGIMHLIILNACRYQPSCPQLCHNGIVSMMDVSYTSVLYHIYPRSCISLNTDRIVINHDVCNLSHKRIVSCAERLVGTGLHGGWWRNTRRWGGAMRGGM